jgi:tetratricopeptide (TPR) repeat protein
MANLQVIKKNYDQAEKLYLKVIALTPNNPVLYNNLGTLYAYKNKFSDAVRCYKKALKIKPDYYEANKNLQKAQKDIK